MRRAVPAANFSRRSLRSTGLLLTAWVAALALTLAAERAEAQNYGSSWSDTDQSAPRKRVDVRRSRSTLGAPREADDDPGSERKHKLNKGDEKGSAAKKPTGPLFAVISVSDQHISVYNSEGLVARSIVSTGMVGHPTPMGVFSIIGRERYHRSNIYSGAPMPFMQRVTWSGVAMHLGVVPGYPASHGCIRLPSGFAQQLWGLTKIGERVVISRRDITPVEFAHPLLPAPKMQPEPAAFAATGSVGARTVVADAAPNDVIQVTGSTDTEPVAAPSAADSKMLNPFEYAAALKAKTASDSTAAAKAVKDTFAAASAKTAEARRAAAALKAAEAAKVAAETNSAAAASAIETAAPEAADVAQIAKINADSELSAAATKLAQATAIEAVKTPESFEAVRLWKEAKAAVGVAQGAAEDAARRVSPISVLVSKKDARVYVRQGLMPVLDAPATIRDPELPLGTHLYIATAQKDDSSLRWSVVSMLSPAGSSEQVSARSKKTSSREERAGQPDAPRLPVSNAAQALERIEFPKDVSEFIAERLWTGGSLIISDQPLSDETSDNGTDLVVKTR